MGTAGSVNQKIKILSYNIHKGFSGGISRYTLDKMREAIRVLQPDLLFLQEIHGEHHGHRKRIKTYPEGSQFEYLATEMWPHFSYGRNVVYSDGHHGNAILSKFPILSSENIDISQNTVERRGILHATILIPKVQEPVHLLCAHLGLLGWQRKKQLEQLGQRIESHVPKDGKVIAAGDFNDWDKAASGIFEKKLGLSEAFFSLTGENAKTFPNWFPFLCLDRVYYQGFKALQATRLNDPLWVDLSDHLALWVELEIMGQ
jgi:endonuclease/exonuclease/phosphatase family metal-dependent hydrolase